MQASKRRSAGPGALILTEVLALAT